MLSKGTINAPSEVSFPTVKNQLLQTLTNIPKVEKQLMFSTDGSARIRQFCHPCKLIIDHMWAVQDDSVSQSESSITFGSINSAKNNVRPYGTPTTPKHMYIHIMILDSVGQNSKRRQNDRLHSNLYQEFLLGCRRKRYEGSRCWRRFPTLTRSLRI